MTAHNITALSLHNISLDIDGAALLKSVSLQFEQQELVALVGPNGAGKTSLLRCAAGLAQASHGEAMIDGKEMVDLSPDRKARLLAYLPQTRPLAWPLRVKDMIALGRYAYGATPGALNEADARAVKKAIDECGLGALAERRTDSLSGGELARAHCARIFAAETPLLIADEPVAALDPRQQIVIMGLLRRYVDRGGGALIVLHDLSLAARFADRIIWMQNSAIVADGPPRDTLTSARIASVFGVTAQITYTEDDGDENNEASAAPSVSITGLAPS